MGGTISIGSLAMYISAIDSFSNSLRAILDSFVENRAFDLYYDQLDACLSVPARILLDGADISDMDYDQYMSLFSTVFQDSRLFSFSLRDNVSLGMPQDDARVEKALRGAGLDPRTELELYERFNDFARGKTAIYITHRLARAHFCDRIIVFENGRILEQGTQEELMKKHRSFTGRSVYFCGIHKTCMSKFIVKYLSYEKKRLLITWLLSFATSLLCLIPASLIGHIIDLATKRNAERELLSFALALGFVYVTISVLNFVAGNIAIQAKMSIYRKLCKDTYQAMMNLSLKEWGKISPETMYQSCVEDVKAIQVISAEKLLEVFSYFVSALGAFLYIGSIYWPLLLFVGVIYCGYFLPAHLLGKRQTKWEEKARQTEYDLRKEFVEIFQRIRLIRIYNMEEREIKRFVEKSDDWGESKYQLVQWYNLFKSIPRFLDSFAPAMVFLIGGYIIARGEVTIGQIVGITVLLPYLNAPIRYYSSYSMQLREAFTKLKDVYQLHGTSGEQEESHGKRRIDVIENISFEGITVRIDGKTILDDFTYRFGKGKDWELPERRALEKARSF